MPSRFIALVLILFASVTETHAATSGNLLSRNNKCLDVTEGKFVNGGQVQLWDCSSSNTNQQWQFTGGQLENGSKCLDLKDGRVVDGGQLQLWDCTQGNANQAWELVGNNLRHTATNMCLDVTRGNYSNGQSLQLWDCDWRSTSNQVWSFTGGLQNVGSDSSTGAGTFYGYPVIDIDDFMSLNSECAWIKDAVVSAANDQGLHPTFLATACIVESSCTVPGNGFGPFQFSDDGAWSQFGGPGKDRQNIWDSAFGAARYFKYLLQQNSDNLDDALRAYNGPLDQGGNPRYVAEYAAWMSGKNAWQLGL